MAKKGPIGKVEAFYIENNYNELELDQIAVDLDRSKTSVENYIKKNLKQIKQKAGLTAGDQFARRPGIVTMTENASAMSDGKRKRQAPSTSCTVKIKND